MSNQTPLMQQAVILDKLHSEDMSSTGNTLIATLRQLEMKIASETNEGRLYLLLQEHGEIGAVIDHLNNSIEQAQLRLAAVLAANRTREDSEAALTVALSSITNTTYKNKLGLQRREKELNQYLIVAPRKRQEAITTLIEAGLTSQEANDRAKPTLVEISAAQDELGGIPAALSAVELILNSRVEQVQILEQEE